MNCGLTRKRLLNKRFSKIEDAIVRVFFRRKGRANTRRIAAEIGAARGTVYNHHKVVELMPQDYEEYVCGLYTEEIARCLRQKNVSLAGLYRRMLIFIMQEQKAFGVLIWAKDREVFVRMVERLRRFNKELDGLAGNTNDIYNIYSEEIAEILFIWGRGGFEREKMDEVLSDILQVTSTMRINLTKLNVYRNDIG